MDRKRARCLYERLVKKSKHVRVWLGYASFESFPLQSYKHDHTIRNYQCIDELPETLESITRSVYDRAYKFMREEMPKHKKEIIMILEAWWEFEKSHASDSGIENKEKYAHRLEEINKKMPRKVKRKKNLYSVEGGKIGTEEFWDLILPEEEFSNPGLKLLEAAYKW